VSLGKINILGDYIVPAGIDKLTTDIGLSAVFKVA
jgi:hypothetical protein